MSRYQHSEFKYIETDLQKIDHVGKIVDNSNMQTPLAVFNTESFGVFEYREKLQQFISLQVIDEENLAEKMPKGFKSIYIDNEAFLIAGGFDPK